MCLLASGLSLTIKRPEREVVPVSEPVLA